MTSAAPANRPKFVFLFGAGASYGAGHIDPKRPPLMQELFDELKDFSPAEWGEESALWRHRESFRLNFESAFAEFVLQVSAGAGISKPFTPGPPALTLLERQWPVAQYFSQFTVRFGARDCYSRLVHALAARNFVHESIFSSINYDCLFERAARGLNLGVRYDGDPDASTVLVLKLHGSCNFVTRDAHKFRALLSSPSTRVELGLETLDTGTGLDAALEDAQSRQEFPVLSLTSPDKETPSATARMSQLRQRWKTLIRQAESVVIIGVRHNPPDQHIAGPIADGRRGMYIGSAEDFAKWHAVNPRLIHLSETFQAGLPKLLIALKVTAPWRAVCQLACQVVRRPADTLRFIKEIW